MPDKPTRPWTDDEIRKVGVAVARIYLEVERGLRNRDHLRRFMTPQAYSAQYADRLSRFPDAGPIRADDIGANSYSRATHDRAMLTLIARESDDKWGAVCIDLQPGPAGHWYVAELTRVQDRNLTHHHAPMLLGATPQRFRQRLLAERTAIETALAAAHSRAAAAKTDLDTLRAADTPNPLRLEAAAERLNAGRQEEQRWQHRLADFHADAATRPAISAGTRSNDHEPTPYLKQLLGPTPADQPERTVWEAAAAIIQVYRLAADITDDHTAFGPQPTDRPLAAARTEAIRQLDGLSQRLAQSRSAHEPSRSTDAPERGIEPPALTQ